MKIAATLSIAMMVAGCSTLPFGTLGEAQPNSIAASPYQLLARPESYDGRRIDVVGVAEFDLGFEGVSLLFATRDDHRLRTDSYIRLYTFADAISKHRDMLERANGRFVRVSGTFHAQAIPEAVPVDHQGIVCLWPECNGGGYLTDVSLVELLD